MLILFAIENKTNEEVISLNFQKYFIQWLVITVLCAVAAFLLNNFVPERSLWPFGMAFLYLGLLNLLVGKVVIDVFGKKK